MPGMQQSKPDFQGAKRRMNLQIERGSVNYGPLGGRNVAILQQIEEVRVGFEIRRVAGV